MPTFPTLPATLIGPNIYCRQMLPTSPTSDDADWSQHLLLSGVGDIAEVSDDADWSQHLLPSDVADIANVAKYKNF